jgi:hypothetical protein
VIGLDEPNRIIQMVQSISELQGFDYLVEWKQSDKVQTTDDNPEAEKKLPPIIMPSIVRGSYLVTEAPYLYRQFIETKYSRNNLYASLKR